MVVELTPSGHLYIKKFFFLNIENLIIGYERYYHSSPSMQIWGLNHCKEKSYLNSISKKLNESKQLLQNSINKMELWISEIAKKNKYSVVVEV